MRRLLDWERDAIVQAMVDGEKREAICAEFGVSRAYPGILARRMGIPARSAGRPPICPVKKSRTRIPKNNYGSNVDEYTCWVGMKARCLNPNSTSFMYYGARGIAICSRWTESFENFLADMGKRPSKNHSIDRINNDGYYEPGNCRWATRSEQRRNRRPQKGYSHPKTL